MSIERCRKHDRNYDTDFTECCPDCERSADWDADVALAESMFTLPEPAGWPAMDDKTIFDGASS